MNNGGKSTDDKLVSIYYSKFQSMSKDEIELIITENKHAMEAILAAKKVLLEK